MNGMQSSEEAGRQLKSSRALKTISEAAEMLDVPQHVLRFWETKFTQIKPLKRNGGRRFYRPEDIDVLIKIKFLLYRQGYTIKGAKKVFDDKNSDQIFARLAQQQDRLTSSALPLANDNAHQVQASDAAVLSAGRLAELAQQAQNSEPYKKDIGAIIESLKAISRELKGESR